MSKPKRVKTEKLSISLPVWLAHAIDEDAQNRAATRSQVIKDALMAEYQKRGKPLRNLSNSESAGSPSARAIGRSCSGVRSAAG